MADGLNRTMIIGNLGRDPELRYTASGTAMCQFNVGVGRSYTQDGQRKEDTEWFRCVVWEKLAEIVGQRLQKGSKVYVEGRMQTRSWDDKGTKKYLTELIANSVIFLDKAPASGSETDPDEIPFEP